MPMHFAPLLATAHMLIAASGEPPRIDIETTCRTSEKEIVKLFGDTSMVTFGTCMKQEGDALEQLKTNWATYPERDKSHCVQAKVYMPSYIEWLTCFELESELRAQESSNAPR
jgi:hypothetical protein